MLSNPVSMRMGKILDGSDRTKVQAVSKPVLARQPCCLSRLPPPEQRAQTFQLDDGVSCESCHGPASGWLGPHTKRTGTHENSVEQIGMYDNRNLIKRSDKMYEMPRREPEKFVDHEMIAAGHPDLTFELSYFSFYMPQHWKTPEQDNAWRNVQAWGVGQAVQLRESLYRLARRAAEPNWPEYAELDCFACHHSLTAADRQLAAGAGLRADGARQPALESGALRRVPDLVEELHPASSGTVESRCVKLAGMMNDLNGSRKQIADTAKHAAVAGRQLGHANQ